MSSKWIAVAFSALIIALPLGQAGWELAHGEPVQALEVFGPIERVRLDRFEEDLHEASLIDDFLSPWYQLALARGFGHGNEKAVLGEAGWLFYGPDLDLITSPGYLESSEGAALEAITDFRDRLEERGIELLLMPVPAKSMLTSRHLSQWADGVELAVNRDHEAFFAELDRREVSWFPVLDLLRGFDGEPYLQRDTHWTPEAMTYVARAAAARVRESRAKDKPEASRRWRLEEQAVSGPGDLVGMLDLPKNAEVFEETLVTTKRVASATDGSEFQPSEQAKVLLLGDSFSGIYADESLGFGSGAGLAAHLAYELNEAVDAIVIAGGSARRVREQWARRAQSDPQLEVVIWQFSQRDLIKGPESWGRIELPPAAKKNITGPPPEAGDTFSVLAELTELSPAPEEFDYPFCLGVMEFRTIEQRSGASHEGPLWVALPLIEDFELTPQASLRIGERYLLTLERIEDHHDLEETPWVDETDAGRDIWFATTMEAIN